MSQHWLVHVPVCLGPCVAIVGFLLKIHCVIYVPLMLPSLQPLVKLQICLFGLANYLYGVDETWVSSAIFIRTLVKYPSSELESVSE